MRIFPAFYVYLLTVGMLAAFGYLSVSGRDLTISAIYLVDYFPSLHAWPLEHIWSLSVEEQFYLLWPAAVLLLMGKRWAPHAALFVVVLGPILRVVSHLAGSTHLPFMFHTRVDSLMFGCLAALAFRDSRVQRLPRIAIVGAAVFLLGVSPVLWKLFGGAYLFLVAYSLEGALIAIILLWTVAHPPRFLNGRLIVHCGVISYSLYLWQQLFLNPSSPFTHPVLSLVALVVLAELSYFCVERPFLRLRDRFARGKKLKSASIAKT